MANHAEKPEKFTGVHFKRWQQKMFFYLTTLNLAQFLEKTTPIPTAQDDAQSISALDAWKHSKFLCRNYVLNGLADPLYNVYCGIKTAKELWESLDKKYKTEDGGTKKFVVARFLGFKMVDSKTVITQVQELQVILHEIHDKGMKLSETFQVAAIIEKLPPSWPKRERAHMADENGEPLVAMITELSAMIEKINLVGDKPQGWFIDTGATRHVCGDKTLFSTFKEAASDAKLFMGNQATVDINGEGNVILKMTSGKELTLSNTYICARNS
ncbi:uncharacterized protein LOC143578550 [Bidens hawaiensis]|uniref:uncharacterized protein LOC143578550 n=1 Tax=Bidens hawaiensis TaxID=980011 RepID=UPI00404ABFF2